MEKMKIAVIGCGMISKVYLDNLTKFDAIEVVGCSDIRPERSKAKSEEYGIKQMTNEEIFADPEIKMVLNITYPVAHYEVTKAALLAGKHVYTEKMTTETVEQANELMKIAADKKLFMGGAPDTFLGGAAQMARRILDSGVIGTPTMAEVFLSRSYHHERFFKGDEKRFAFCRHGGIIFDMGAYYFTELVFLMGAIDQVVGFSQIRDPNRKYLNPQCPLYGQDMTVESWNNTTGSIKFKSGALGTITTSSEAGGVNNRFVIYCTDGRIDLGDPNNYDPTIKIYNKNSAESVITSTFGYTGGNFRGIGLLDAVYAIQNGRAPRCTAELNRHVLEAALGICESSQTGKVYSMTTTAERPQPLEAGHTDYPELVFRV